MQVVSEMWLEHQNMSDISVPPTVVFTSEATSMVKELETFVAENRTLKYPFKFEFVTNGKDVTPDSGFMRDIGMLHDSGSSKRVAVLCFNLTQRLFSPCYARKIIR
jgi:hypothetical protein